MSSRIAALVVAAGVELVAAGGAGSAPDLGDPGAARVRWGLWVTAAALLAGAVLLAGLVRAWRRRSRTSAQSTCPATGGTRHTDVARGAVAGPGGTAGDVATAEDLEVAARVTELRRQRDELAALVDRRTAALRAADADLQAFVGAGHDLRGPLASIRGLVFLLRSTDGDGLSERGHKSLDLLDDHAERMRALIDGLLGLLAPRGPLVRVRVDLSALADEVARQLTTQSPDRAVQWSIQPGLHTDGDPALLRSLLAHLLGNAFKFTRDEPAARIVFRRAVRDGTACYEVADNGVGIDPADADAVWAPFARSAGARSFPGNGLGLATVQRIVRCYGGQVGVDAAPGRGSTFWFTLAPS